MKFYNTLLLLLLTISTWAQSIKVVKGDLSFLKGQTGIKVKYEYHDMKVGKMTETAYVTEKAEKYNKDEPGRGDKWKEAWVNDRSSRFEPKFVELFDKYAAKTGLQIKEEGDYTMIFHTTWTEPGFNVYVARAPAVINAEISIVDASGTEKAKLTITGSKGRTFGGYDFDTGTRISECYALAGKGLGKFFAKALK